MLSSAKNMLLENGLVVATCTSDGVAESLVASQRRIDQLEEICATIYERTNQVYLWSLTEANATAQRFRKMIETEMTTAQLLAAEDRIRVCRQMQKGQKND